MGRKGLYRCIPYASSLLSPCSAKIQRKPFRLLGEIGLMSLMEGIRHIMAPSLPSKAAGSLALCLDIDYEIGLEENGEVIFRNDYNKTGI